MSLISFVKMKLTPEKYRAVTSVGGHRAVIRRRHENAGRHRSRPYAVCAGWRHRACSKGPAIARLVDVTDAVLRNGSKVIPARGQLLVRRLNRNCGRRRHVNVRPTPCRSIPYDDDSRFARTSRRAPDSVQRPPARAASSLGRGGAGGFESAARARLARWDQRLARVRTKPSSTADTSMLSHVAGRDHALPGMPCAASS
jgi:hypothetical protein